MRTKTIFHVVTAFVLTLFACACRKTVGGSDTMVVRETVVQTVVADDPGAPPDDLKSLHPTADEWLAAVCAQEHPGDSIIAYNFTLFGSGDKYIACLTGSKEHPENERRIDYEPKEMWYLLPEAAYKGLSFQQANAQFAEEVKRFAGTAAFRQSFFGRARTVTINHGRENLAVQ